MKKKSISILILLFCITNLNFAQQLQNDSVKVIKAWKLSSDNLSHYSINIDTALSEFHNYNPVYQNNISTANLGNYGLAAIPHSFRKQLRLQEFIFFQGYEDYFHDSRSAIYYNTKRPYTNIMYSGGGSNDDSGQNIKLIHTQNINRYINVGINYDLISSIGHYKRQKAKNHSFSLFASYRSNNYNLYSSFSTNKFKIEENGGLQNDNDISGIYSTSTLPVNLNNAESILRNNNFSITQEFLLGPDNKAEPADSQAVDSIAYFTENDSAKLKLIHNLYINSSYRIFEDQDPQSGFYRSIYFDEQNTFDSVKYRNISNTIHMLKEDGFLGMENMGWKVLLGNRLLNAYYYQKDTSFLDNYLSLSLFNRSSTKLSWNIKSKYNLTGYNSGDYKLSLNISLPINGSISSYAGLKTSLSRKKPDYYLLEYQSNNFAWKNEFNKESFADAELYYSNDLSKLYASLSYTLVNNFIYFDSLAAPSQFNSGINVISINLKKDFNFGKWTFANKIILQHTDNKDIVRIPQISTYNQIYRKGYLFRRALDTRIGLQVHYNTGFYTYAYMPATGQFYHQNERLLGNYPYFDIFLNLKVKRTRFFLIYEHFNSWFMKQNYFHILHYPMKSAFFKFGLSWSFYD